VIQSAIGGMNLTTTIEGRSAIRERALCPGVRGDIEQLKKVIVPLTGMGASQSAAQPAGMGSVLQASPISNRQSPIVNPLVSLGELADIKVVRGPMGIRARKAS